MPEHASAVRPRNEPAAARARHSPRPLAVRALGLVEYAAALELQRTLVLQRRADDIPDTLLLLEHPHVITLGTSAHRDHVLIDDAQGRLLGIDICDTGRGGDVTYHGPGQLVGYPILDLKPDRCDVHRYVRDMEEALIRALASLGVDAARKDGLTGVWVNDEKIAAIGVRVSSGWITSHGFAFNVTTDLAYFNSIVPCGISDHGVTSLQHVLGNAPPMEHVSTAVVAAFAAVFCCRPAETRLPGPVR
ncbi:MAG TPA: lipoyl(octanoyl) transferase LipB [Longimicrobiales bacterium]|nr:lipoyl(octanoyl) transferase LipB [Longimicrobiales bacterium]